MKKRLAAFAVLASCGLAAYAFYPRAAREEAAWRIATVERGDVESVVTATGTLGAVRTVQVGTQTSGLIASLLVDFNDRVREGQVIATLDTTLLQSAVRDGEAALERAEAELRKAKRGLDRLTATHAQGITSAADLDAATDAYDVARAGVKSAEVAVARARENLGYATIRAPVSGTVVERDVDVGQTVAASLSAPKLFLIANDLSEMQILVPVDESDIGRVKAGQAVRFTVKAYGERRFPGSVKQVRLQSATEQNVVRYTVVVSVKNPDGALLPGMTATVEFVTARVSGVLKVANAALRFRPATPARAASGPQAAAPPSDPRAAPDNVSLLWLLDERGALRPLPVRTGITDGLSTEVSAPGLSAGTKVATGTKASSKAAEPATEAASNPFQGSSRGGPGGGPPPPPGGF